MSNILGAIAATAVTVGVTNGLHNRRVHRAHQHWHSPLSQLGRNGIFTARASSAINQTFAAMSEIAAPDWMILPTPSALGSVERFTVISGDNLAMIETALGEDYVGAVRRVDEHAWTLSQQVHGTPVHRFVCRADSDGELRELPGPSGNPVTVTGLPWLGGLLRRCLDSNTNRQPVDPYFDRLLSTTQRLVVDHGNTHMQLALEFVQPTAAGHAMHPWWIVKDLCLDDGIPGTLDLAIVGPTGVYAVHFPVDDTPQAATVVSGYTSRLRAYLPDCDVIPIVATSTLTAPRFGPDQDAAQYPIAHLPPDRIADFIRTTSVRGLKHGVHLLYTPFPGWYLRPVRIPDGISISYRMPQPAEQ